MNWTKTLPAVDGFYGIRAPEQVTTIVQVHSTSSDGTFKPEDVMLNFIGSDMGSSLKEILSRNDCEWYGPIVLPEGDKNVT